MDLTTTSSSRTAWRTGLPLLLAAVTIDEAHL